MDGFESVITCKIELEASKDIGGQGQEALVDESSVWTM